MKKCINEPGLESRGSLQGELLMGFPDEDKALFLSEGSQGCQAMRPCMVDAAADALKKNL